MSEKDDVLTVWTKQLFSEGQYAAVKAHMVVEASIDDVVCVIKDLEHRSKWNPDVDVAKVIEKDGNRDIAYIVVTPPVSMISKREQIIGRRFERKKDEFISIVKSMPHKDYPDGKSDMVRTEILISVVRVTQIDEKRAKIQTINQTNINGWIPYWISSTIQTYVPRKMMGQLPAGFKYYRDLGLVEKINKELELDQSKK